MKMGFLEIFLIQLAFVLTLTDGISITSNGNSPERKILSLDIKNVERGGFVPINPIRLPVYSKSLSADKTYLNTTKLPVNERYRRLIPYMTFYLANDFTSPQNEVYSNKQQNAVSIQNGKSISTPYSNIPRYQGNRLSQFNIASAFPTKVIQEYTTQSLNKYSAVGNPVISEDEFRPIHGITRAPPVKEQNVYKFQRPIAVPVKINSNNNYNSGDISNTHYYSSEPQGQIQQYKLVPYDQTPPIKVQEYNADYFVPKVNYKQKPAPFQSYQNEVRENLRSQYIAEQQLLDANEQKQQNNVYKYTPTAPSDSYLSSYTARPNNQVEFRPAKNYVFKKPTLNLNPTTLSGFQPMISTQSPKYTYETSPYSIPVTSEAPTYSQVTRKPQFYYRSRPTKQPVYIKQESEDYTSTNMNYGPSSGDQFEQNNLAKILKSLQNSHSLPHTITKDNIDSSIKTLVQILNNLKGNENYIEENTQRQILSTPEPFRVVTPNPLSAVQAVSPPLKFRPRGKTVHVKQRLQPVRVYEPLQDIEIEQVPVEPLNTEENDDLGGTPGKPGVDYPNLSVIPSTSFDCKMQRYKGFFGDPETKCQVWHYCDLNGGQASFLCPNGTIFSQVALTCDWWFNVKCSSTAQLYVLNERLYKYILPYSPKFPEDYSGPLVDKYLTIKFKEMEEKMKKKKKVLMPETELETEKADVIEIKTSGMSGALRPYDN